MATTTYVKVSDTQVKRITERDPEEQTFSLEERLEVQARYAGELKVMDDELARTAEEIARRKSEKQAELDSVTKDVDESRALGAKTTAEIAAEAVEEPIEPK